MQMCCLKRRFGMKAENLCRGANHSAMAGMWWMLMAWMTYSNKGQSNKTYQWERCKFCSNKRTKSTHLSGTRYLQRHRKGKYVYTGKYPPVGLIALPVLSAQCTVQIHVHADVVFLPITYYLAGTSLSFLCIYFFCCLAYIYCGRPWEQVKEKAVIAFEQLAFNSNESLCFFVCILSGISNQYGNVQCTLHNVCMHLPLALACSAHAKS